VTGVVEAETSLLLLGAEYAGNVGRTAGKLGTSFGGSVTALVLAGILGGACQSSSTHDSLLNLILFIYLSHQKLATICKHRTHKTHTQKYNTSIEHNKRILDMNSLCRRLPDIKLDSNNSLPQQVYTVLTSNCHKATR